MSEAATTSATPSAPATQAGSSPVIDQSAGNETESTTQQASAKVAPTPEATKPEVYELKVNGKTMRLSREELLQNASLGFAADQRFKEASQLRKQAEGVIGKLRDPNQVIETLLDPSLGLSKDQIKERFEEWYAKEFIEPEQLSPDQRKIREYEQKLQKYAQDEKSREAEKAKAHEESLTSQAREEIQNEIIAALDTGKLSKTNASIRRLAKWISINQSNGFNAPPDVLVAQVKKEISQEIRDLTEASDGDVLVQMLGDGVIQKLRKYDLEQLRKMRGQSAPQAPAPTPKRDETPISSSNVTMKLRELARTGNF